MKLVGGRERRQARFSDSGSLAVRAACSCRGGRDPQSEKECDPPAGPTVAVGTALLSPSDTWPRVPPDSALEKRRSAGDRLQIACIVIACIVVVKKE
jgi:hypothetical protein